MQFPVFAAWVFIGVSVTTARIIDEFARADDESERIIGGSSAEAGQFPYAAALYEIGLFRNRFVCTASILSPTNIMTAAHCVYSNGVAQAAETLYLIANVNREAPAQRLQVAEVIVHPDYDEQTIDNDIAILKTVETAVFDDEVGPVCIARNDTEAMEYTNATAMGWGARTWIRADPSPRILQHVEQEIIGNAECQIEGFYPGGVDENKLCARGGRTKFNGVCNGDSGGPLVHLSVRQPVEIGIASYINTLIGCGTPGPAVFTRVSAYYDWIMNATMGESVCVV